MVAPSRARGLKHQRRGRMICTLRVAPSRARGLKLKLRHNRKTIGFVAPSRARGLKPLILCQEPVTHGRALTGAWIETTTTARESTPTKRRALTGAWIETQSIESLQTAIYSRALTGAWIETKPQKSIGPKEKVAPSRARGLKPLSRHRKRKRLKSRPHGRVD